MKIFTLLLYSCGISDTAVACVWAKQSNFANYDSKFRYKEWIMIGGITGLHGKGVCDYFESMGMIQKLSI